MGKVLILDKRFYGVENLAKAVILLKKEFSEIPVVVIEPAIRGVLSAQNVHSELISHLLSEDEDSEIYMRAELTCRKINNYLGQTQGATFHGLSLFDLNLLDIAYTLRHLFSLDYLARNKNANTDWLFVSMRLQFLSNYNGLYKTDILNPLQVFGTNRYISQCQWLVNQIRQGTLHKAVMQKVIKILGRRVSKKTHQNQQHKQIVYPKNKPGKRSVLFSLTETASKLASSSFIPLIKQLTQQRNIQIVVAVNSKEAAKTFENVGTGTIFPLDILSQEATEHLDYLCFNLQRSVVKQMDQLVSGSVEYNLWYNYLGYGLEYLEDSYKSIIFYENLYKHFQPDVLITNNDRSPQGKAAVLMARSLGIPSMQYYPCLIKVHSWYKDCYTDAIGVYGLHGEKCVRANGLEDKKIYRIGNPKFDSIIEQKRKKDRRKVFEHLNISLNQYLILILGTLVVKGADKWLNAITREFKIHNNPWLSVWIKPHPGDISGEYQTIIRNNQAEEQVNLLDKNTVENYELLSVTDVVITDFSTLGSEALLMGIPTIVVNLTDSPYCVQFDKDGAAELVTRIEDFWEKLSKLLSNPQRRAKLTQAYSKVEKLYGERIDGRATQRFIKAIEDLGDFKLKGD